MYIAWILDDQAPDFAEMYGVHKSQVIGSLKPLTCKGCADFLCSATAAADSINDIRVAFKETCTYRACDTKCIAWPTCPGGLQAGCSQPVRRQMMKPLEDRVAAMEQTKTTNAGALRQLDSKALPARGRSLVFSLLPVWLYHIASACSA